MTLRLFTPSVPPVWSSHRTVTSAVAAKLRRPGSVIYVVTPAGLVPWGEWRKERA